MKNKYTLLIVGVAFLLTWLSYLIYLKVPKRSWDYYGETREFSVSPLNVKPGDKVSWTANICRYSNTEYIMGKYLKNFSTGNEVLIDRIEDVGIKSGECKDIPVNATIPFHAEKGMSVIIMRFTTRKDLRNLYPTVDLYTSHVVIE